MSHLNDLIKIPISEFIVRHPQDIGILKDYPEATHWAINDRKCLVLYKLDIPQVIINDFSRGSELD
jgi:hypothetical protein